MSFLYIASSDEPLTNINVVSLLWQHPTLNRPHSVMLYLMQDFNSKVSRKEGKGAVSLSSNISLAVR